jgi:hydrogenase/urease accessory protein HupE
VIGATRQILIAGGLAVLAAAASLSAHALSVSYAQFTVQDRTITASVRLPLDDVDLLLRLDRDLDGQISAAELDASREVVQRYVNRHLQLRADDQPLAGHLAGLAPWRDPSAFQYLEADLEFTAGRPVGRVSIRSDFLTELYPSHKTLGDVQIGGRREQFVFEPQRVYEGRLAERRAWATAASFVRLGVEHIFTGYDHILFLFGLLLIGRGLRNLVAIVTSFTVAHSATLALATLGIVRPAPWTIEAAIALSIAYIGFENLFVENPRYRWKIAFVFGLVHGFGFATVLREMHLPRAGLMVSLFSFNIGVEIGQIAIVCLMYPLLRATAETRYRPIITRVASSAIALVGLVWFYQRIP